MCVCEKSVSVCNSSGRCMYVTSLLKHAEFIPRDLCLQTWKWKSKLTPLENLAVFTNAYISILKVEEFLNEANKIPYHFLKWLCD